MIMTEVQRVCDSDWIEHGPCNGCAETISQRNANFSLDGVPSPHLLVDQDKIGCLTVRGAGKTRCDFIFFADNAPDKPDWVAPIEMSSGRWKKQNEIKDQLQAGANLVRKKVPVNKRLDLRPIYVGHFRRPELLRQTSISFNGEEYEIKPFNLNESIAPAFQMNQQDTSTNE